MKRWLTFIHERFEPVSHLLMIGALFGANLSLTRAFVFSPNINDPGQIFQLVVCFIVTLLFFFHLRLFDELKDYRTDLEVNRDRPLPRGLINLNEYKLVMVGTILTEIVLAAVFLGAESLYALLIAIAYSMLMFKEFFVGDWIRPKMELYAISHTLVSGLVALFVGVASAQTSIQLMPRSFILVMALNWMIFNVFEFARKTFAPSEERNNVESYSSRWGVWGGLIWTFAFVFLASTILYRLNISLLGWKPWFVSSAVLVSLGVVLAGLGFGLKKTEKMAKTFRLVCSLYLVLFNFILAFGFF